MRILAAHTAGPTEVWGADYASLQETVEEFLAEVQTSIDVRSCNVAGPGINSRVKITDLFWASDEATLTTDLNLKTVHLPKKNEVYDQFPLRRTPFFGATGDLAYKNIFPSLQAMVKRGHLKVPVVGVAKAGWTSISSALARQTVWKNMAALILQHSKSSLAFCGM